MQTVELLVPSRPSWTNADVVARRLVASARRWGAASGRAAGRWRDVRAHCDAATSLFFRVCVRRRRPMSKGLTGFRLLLKTAFVLLCS